MSDPAADLMARAKRHLDLVAEGEAVSENLQQGLAAIVKVALQLDTASVTLEAAENVVLALQQAVQPAAAFFGDYPRPSTIDLALRSAGGIVRTFGAPEADWSPSTRDLYPGWLDCTLILLAEADAAMRWRRVGVRAQALVDKQGVTGAATGAGAPTLH